MRLFLEEGSTVERSKCWRREEAPAVAAPPVAVVVLVEEEAAMRAARLRASSSSSSLPFLLLLLHSTHSAFSRRFFSVPLTFLGISPTDPDRILAKLIKFPVTHFRFCWQLRVAT